MAILTKRENRHLSFCVILLPPGTPARDPIGEAPCTWQLSAAEPPCGGTLAEAVSAARQAGRGVHLVLSASEAVVSAVALSRRQARHLRRIAPYLLEDRLLDPPEELWFSTGKGRGGKYPVVACRQDFLRTLVDFLEHTECNVESLQVDAELLRHRAPLRFRYPGQDESLLVLEEEYLVVPEQQLDEVAGLTGTGTREPEVLEDETAIFPALREGLEKAAGTNLLHSELRPANASPSIASGWWESWKPLAGTAAAALLVVWAMLLVQQWQYRLAADRAHEQAAALYQELFPGDRLRAGAERRQFQARLNELARGGGTGSGFLQMLAPLGRSLAGAPEQGVEIRRIHYEERDGVIQLDLGAEDFDRLQQVRQRMLEAGLDAEITEGRSRDDRVTARIRVEQA